MKEKKGLGEIGRREERREGRVKGRIVKGIVMVLVMMVMGCNSGGVKGEGTGGGEGKGVGSLSEVLLEVGRSAENAFYAFIELMSDVLGFKVNKDTKRSDVASYFNNLGGKIGEAAGELEKVASKAMVGVDKSDESKNAIRVAVDAAKEVLNLLKTHLESLGTVGDENVVGDANNIAGVGTVAEENLLKKALKALQGIVNIAKSVGVSELKTTSITLQAVGGVDNKDGAKILSTNTNPVAQDAAKAALIVSTISGEGILESIVKSNEGDSAVGASDANVNTTAVAFAKGGTAANLAKEAAKAASVAGGIALRSLVKSGKLATAAAAGNAGGQGEIQAVGVSAANKLLIAVEDIIKKTVKNVIEKAKQDVDKARDPKKTSGQQ
ncbi:Variable major outer membrane lipoprotein (plasmid) [Borrelia crocidurae DOU]|uniref:Variable large protein n=1 Tax=Borrelia crocidurae DOU TaxID=1293575 RepID=W5SL91_9SPIR|nr:variable large family protein [Borrelia crocidurae]AHH07655.1 Variable major outer membrane lipoprotein [Borrelia crocidurae DOU]